MYVRIILSGLLNCFFCYKDKTKLLIMLWLLFNQGVSPLFLLFLLFLLFYYFIGGVVNLMNLKPYPV